MSSKKFGNSKYWKISKKAEIWIWVTRDHFLTFWTSSKISWNSPKRKNKQITYKNKILRKTNIEFHGPWFFLCLGEKKRHTKFNIFSLLLVEKPAKIFVRFVIQCYLRNIKHNKKRKIIVSSLVDLFQGFALLSALSRSRWWRGPATKCVCEKWKDNSAYF